MGSASPVPVREDRGEGGTTTRRRWWRWLVALCLVALGVALLHAAASRPPTPTPPTPYGGSDTANDDLEQVVTDPMGGVWVVGLHYDRRLVVGEPGGTLLSSFVLHDEDGTWIKRYVLPSSLTGLGTLAMTSPSEGWLLGQADRHGLVVHYTGGIGTTAGAPQFLTDVAMVSANEGWAVGDKGSILHDVAGEWDVTASPTSAQLRGVVMIPRRPRAGPSARAARSCTTPAGSGPRWRARRARSWRA